MMSKEIVLLPGTLCTGEVFAAQVKALEAEDYKCINIDYGLADSVVEMAKKTLAAVTQNQFSIIAFSMGGMVAFELLRQVPERINGLVLVASNAHADLPGRAELRATHLQLAKSEGLTALLKETYMPNYLTQQQPEHQALILRMAQSLGVDVFAAQLNVLAERPDSTALLSQVCCPTLICGGRQDPLCPVTEQQRMHGLIPHSQLHLFASCGHFVSLEQAEALTGLLTDWLRSDALA